MADEPDKTTEQPALPAQAEPTERKKRPYRKSGKPRRKRRKGGGKRPPEVPRIAKKDFICGSRDTRDGELVWHIMVARDPHEPLCGVLIDGLSYEPVARTSEKQLITCAHCFRLWLTAHRVTLKCFARMTVPKL